MMNTRRTKQAALESFSAFLARVRLVMPDSLAVFIRLKPAMVLKNVDRLGLSHRLSTRGNENTLALVQIWQTIKAHRHHQLVGLLGFPGGENACEAVERLFIGEND
jgi:hypothetical protein